MNDSVCDVILSRGSDCAAVCGSQVMIIGNHSAGKSSFVNWYVGEDIQPTGMAVHTLVGFGQAWVCVQRPCLLFVVEPAL